MGSSPDLPAIPNIDENSYRLIISDAVSHDNNVAELSQSKITQLKLQDYSTIIILTSDKDLRTTCTSTSLSSCPINEIKMNRVIRHNLRLRLGDPVVIEYCGDISGGKHLHIAFIDDTIQNLTGNLYEVFLKPYFEDRNRPKLLPAYQMDATTSTNRKTRYDHLIK
ncbi:unnamed protein product [Adineta steineri]|uniref:CDC48 N-terminal subdomain domain-containing protein n=1 Tax=Adineta steineri TaxID=433720 RepID=A0A813VBN0_9BILA|nr:unnamed protein product [Adineta steineri]CAF1493426.1 unnamed protein product [Adineta steineri]CAF3967778.1 unnamed protein product [Adineta steineri]CAF3991537.1 unnamed protein product [Adineta steineri]